MTEDQILLKLVIKGMDPAEVQQLAASTQGELNARIKTYLDQLVGLHKQANAATTDDARQSVQDQIKETEKQVDAVNKVARAHEIAANRASNGWRRTMEDLENIATVARAVIDVAVAGFNRFVALGDQIDKVTNIYGGLTGSIREMQIATDGEVAAIDLITTKTRAFEKDLHLTDAQFGIVAASADAFADKLGGNTKEALDKLIDGLATGRKRMLENVGAVVDEQKAYEDYAKQIGTTADKLSEHGRATAMAQASLHALDEKLAESGGVVRDFSHEWEKMSADLHNMFDGLLLSLGQFLVKSIQGLTVDLPNAVKISIAKLKDLATFNTQHYEAQARAAYGAELDALDTNYAGVNAAKKRLAAGDSSYQIADRDPAAAVDRKKVQEEIDKQTKLLEAFEKDWGKLMSGGVKPKDRTGYDTEADQHPNLFQMGISKDLHDDGSGTVGPKDEELDKLMGSTKPTDELLAKLEEDVKARSEEMEAKLNTTAEKAGGGIFARMLFGPTGKPDTLYEDMDAFQKASVDGMGMVAASAHKMADAVGASIAASIAGDKAHAASVRQITHDILEGLAAQAIGKALFATAEGVYELAHYHFDAAALDFEAAALFGAIGVGAGLGARAVGTGDTGASSGASAGGGGSSGFTSGPRDSGSNSTGQNKAPITVNISNVLPGSEAEVGRQVVKALSAYTRESGSTISDLTTGKAA